MIAHRIIVLTCVVMLLTLSLLLMFGGIDVVVDGTRHHVQIVPK